MPRGVYRRHLRPLTERFWSKVDKGDGSGCWIWTAATNGVGYGKLQVGCRYDGTRRFVLAHRLAWELIYGSAPERWLLHRCDNPPCVRPDHLFEGDVVDNARDMVAKGRQKKGPCPANAGANNRFAKLTHDEAQRIRRLRMTGVGIADLARRFHVSKALITRVIYGRHWAVRGEPSLRGLGRRGLGCAYGM
jgi:HNH endonuclease